MKMREAETDQSVEQQDGDHKLTIREQISLCVTHNGISSTKKLQQITYSISQKPAAKPAPCLFLHFNKSTFLKVFLL